MATLGTHPDQELFLDDDASPLVDDRLAVGEEVLIGQHPAQSPLGLPLLGDVERHPEPGLAVRTSAPAQPAPSTALGAVAVLEVHEPIAGKRPLGVPRVPIQFTESLPAGGFSLRRNFRSSCDSTGWRGAGCPQPCVWMVWG